MSIYRFTHNGHHIILDVNSSNVFEVDKAAYDVLEYYPKYSQADILSRFKGQFSSKLLLEIVGEIDELITLGKLYSKNPPLKDLAATVSGGVKAMCLNITHDCNLRCRYCFASGGDYNGERAFMGEATARLAIDWLIAHSGKRKNLEIDFFGGEPLMNFDVLQNTVTYARGREEESGKVFKFTVTTNATLITDKILDYFNRQMHNVVLSIDGRKRVNDAMRPGVDQKGSYDRVASRITRAVAWRGERSYYVRSTYTADNLDFSEDVAHLAQLGFRNLSSEPVVADPSEPYAIRPEHLPEIKAEYDRLSEYYLKSLGTDHEFNFFHFNLDIDSGTCYYKKLGGCGAGSEYVAVTPNGDIYPCHQFVGQEGFVLGNVAKHGFNVRLREQFRSTNFLSRKACSGCWCRFFCGGGCYASAYHATGDIGGVYELGCELLKKRVECALYLKCVQKTSSLKPQEI